MTPSEDPLFAAVNDSEVQAVIDAGGQPVFDHYRMGGADAFLDFIATELQPLVEANYPADPDDATIVGASLGGTFATYALFERPELFERYVIVSPGLNWDDAMLMDLEAEYAANHEDLSARVFLAAGGLEELERQVESMLAGTHPRAVSIGAIVEEPDYHARLLRYVRAYRAHPDTEAPLRENIAADPHWQQLERTFG
ncbi:MAG: alpha/beta hydrolase, partial [Myxococcales bacterium]|nr:alpha/beta hydrolase [Myxococcales bacterium]